jgi:predicted nucleotidyltransferase component of viral defense system
MKFHLEGLGKNQISVLKQTGSTLRKNGYYLAGGTALAIHFGHRLSVDLDWFTSNDMGDALTLAQKLRKAGVDFKTDQTASGTLHGSIAKVCVSFLEFHYPLLKPLLHWEEMDCSLASLEDLACMKLSAIAQRGARKDFCDILVLGLEKFSLKEMLSMYQKKFKVRDVGHVLYGLVYFDDAENERMPKMLWDVRWAEVKKIIQGWVKQIKTG